MDCVGLILAGVRAGGDPFAQAEGIAHKSLLEVDGKVILSRVCGALAEAGVDPIVVSTSEPGVAAVARQLGAQVIPAADSGPSASVAAAFEQYGSPMLVTTSDHALLEADWVRQLVADTPHGSDVSVMLAKREAVEAALPESRRTWLHFADGDWSGCNLFLLAGPAADRALTLWSEVEANRKRPWRIAMRLGFWTLLNYALGRLGLVETVSRLGARVGLRVAVVSAADGLAAVDVDKAEDLAQVRALIESANS